MPTQSPRSTRNLSVNRIYQSLGDMENRLAERMDSAFRELKEYVKETRTKAELLEQRLDAHEATPNHPLGEQRLVNLERTVSGIVSDDKGHALRVWQVIVACIVVLTSVVGSCTGVLSLLLTAVYYFFIRH